MFKIEKDNKILKNHSSLFHFSVSQVTYGLSIVKNILETQKSQIQQNFSTSLTFAKNDLYYFHGFPLYPDFISRM